MMAGVFSRDKLGSGHPFPNPKTQMLKENVPVCLNICPKLFIFIPSGQKNEALFTLFDFLL